MLIAKQHRFHLYPLRTYRVYGTTYKGERWGAVFQHPILPSFLLSSHLASPLLDCLSVLSNEGADWCPLRGQLSALRCMDDELTSRLCAAMGVSRTLMRGLFDTRSER